MNTLILVVAYFVTLAFLVGERGMEGWGPYAIAAIPAFIVGRFWKAILGLAMVGLIIAAFLHSK
ncbi:hypothetical protein MnTg02_01581 [bacterium MnTg02]|nr:hypothetical protein MnTg02_01581 [bacterium MnTg02]